MSPIFLYFNRKRQMNQSLYNTFQNNSKNWSMKNIHKYHFLKLPFIFQNFLVYYFTQYLLLSISCLKKGPNKVLSCFLVEMETKFSKMILFLKTFIKKYFKSSNLTVEHLKLLPNFFFNSFKMVILSALKKFKVEHFVFQMNLSNSQW